MIKIIRADKVPKIGQLFGILKALEEQGIITDLENTQEVFDFNVLNNDNDNELGYQISERIMAMEFTVETFEYGDFLSVTVSKYDLATDEEFVDLLFDGVDVRVIE